MTFPTSRGVPTAFGVLLTAIAAMAPAPRAFAQADRIAATVNNEIITQDEVFTRLMSVRGQDFFTPTNPPQLRNETAGQIVLNALITERLILQYATKENIAGSDAEITGELDAMLKQPSVQSALAAHVLTQDVLRYNLTVQVARFNLATAGFSVTPAEVEAYYKAHLAAYTTPDRWGLSVIRADKPETVTKVQADLKAGKVFADVAKSYSDDTRSKDAGGDLGMLPVTDPGLPQVIRDAVKALKPGDVSPPVKLDMDAGAGKPKVTVWWFVRLNKQEPHAVRPLADVNVQVEKLALMEKAGGGKVADKKMSDFRKQSTIRVNLPGFAGQP